MTSREKVRRLFEGKSYEGMVIDFGGMYSDGISAIAYAKLLKYLGIEERIKLFDISQQLAAPSLEVVNRLGGDFMLAYRMRLRYGISAKEWKEDVLKDGTKCLVPYTFMPVIDAEGNRNLYMDGKLIARMPKDGFYYDQVSHPLEGVEDVKELEEIFRPEYFQKDEVDYIADEVSHLYRDTDKAIVFGFGGSIFEQGQLDFNYETFYYNLAAEKEIMYAYFEKLTEAYLYNLGQVLSKVGDKVDAIHFRDDLGTQRTLQISVPMYREMIKPFHKKMFDFVHDNYPNIRILLHSCGAIFDVIPDLIDAGVNILNPVQISAKGMVPEKLKKAYGDRLIFWGGGADLQQFVMNHNVQEIKRHVAELIETFNQNGNYIFSQIHNFQHDVPPEKILAIFDTAKQYKNA